MINITNIIGKTFREFDTWDSSAWMFTIEDILIAEDGSILLKGTAVTYWGKKEQQRSFRLSIEDLYKAATIRGGFDYKKETIDGCSVSKRIDIFEMSK